MLIRAMTAAIALLASYGSALAGETTLNGITVVCPWAEATNEGTKVGPVYMDIRADSSRSRRLTGAYSELAEQAELQSFDRIAGVLKRQRVDHIGIPAGGTTRLMPGGFHVLLVGLKEQLLSGTSFGTYLEFDGEGGFVVPVQVVPVGAGNPCAPRTGGGGGGGGTRVVPGGAGFIDYGPPIWIPRGSH